ncbi:hypothetical protein LguiB_009157 [Lonicera macranthoides]
MASSQEASSLATLLIQKCTCTTTLKKARQLHARILTSTPSTPQSPYLNNNIISMYVRCSYLGDAHLVFDKMPQRNIVSYNALIAASSRSCSDAHLAFKLLARVQIECLRPNGLTFTSLLQASSCLQDHLLGSSLHTQSMKFGFLDDICVQTSLLGMYSNCGDLKCAMEVFNSMGYKDAMAWNSLIFGYMKNEKIVEGLHLFSRMRNGDIPTQFTYSMVLNACSRLGDKDNGQLIHAQVIVSGITTDLPLQNALLDMYCSCGDAQTAFRIFSMIKNPDLVSWNSMIAGYLDNGDGEKAMNVFIQFSRTSFAKPDEYTFASVISATGTFPASDYGRPLHAQVNKVGLEMSVYVGSTLISMYFNNGEAGSAQKIFSFIIKKDVILWTEMITGYSRTGNGENAIECFHKMSQEGLKIDSFSLSIALSACADLATLRQGEIIHCQVIKTGHDVEMNVCGSLIDMYAKIGDLQTAESILYQVKNPDLRCWNSMLGGYGHHGKAEEAFKVFDEMLKRGLKSDQVTFISLLAACSHCGLIDKGKFLWTYMKENGLKPGPKHYSCMVSLLSRAGLLNEAEEMIEQSPFSGDYVDLWRTLLSSCVSCGNLNIGLRVAERILKIDGEDSATNILLTNLYAAVGRWDCVAEMRRKIRGSMVERDPAVSKIEVAKGIHAFSSGDRSHLWVEEMEAELYRLRGNLMLLETDEI